MKIQVSVKTNARAEKVEPLGPTELKVSVNAPPQEGRANEAVIRLLAKHFGVPLARVQIKAGHKSKRKLVEVL